MDCQEFEARLEQRLDERLDPRTPDLVAHADQCVACREQFDQAVFLLRAVAKWRQQVPAVSQALTARIVDSLQPTAAPAAKSSVVTAVEVRPLSHEKAAGKWQAWVVAAGSVAALWLMFVGSAARNGNQPDRQLTAVGYEQPSVTPQNPKNTVPVAPKADLETVLVSAEGAYSQIANESFAVAQDFAMLWPNSHAVSDTTAPPVMPQNSSDAWNQDWPQNLAPIGDSVNETLNFLWRATPHTEKSAS